MKIVLETTLYGNELILQNCKLMDMARYMIPFYSIVEVILLLGISNILLQMRIVSLPITK